MPELVENNNDRRSVKFNLGDTLHIIQIAVLLISLGVMYEKVQIFEDQVTKHGYALDRIEHYLSSKDTNYWKDSRKSE